MNEKTYQTRIYWEDTDAGGVVYYANYLKYAERARTEYLRELGVNQQELIEEKQIAFVVRRVEVDYFASAKLDDEIEVRTQVIKQGKASIEMSQEIHLLSFPKTRESLLTKLHVKIACIDTETGKPTKIPFEF